MLLDLQRDVSAAASRPELCDENAARTLIHLHRCWACCGSSLCISHHFTQGQELCYGTLFGSTTACLIWRCSVLTSPSGQSHLIEGRFLLKNVFNNHSINIKSHFRTEFLDENKVLASCFTPRARTEDGVTGGIWVN